MSVDDETLGKLLQQQGLLTGAEYEAAMSARRESGRPLPDILLEKSYISRAQLDEVLKGTIRHGQTCPRCETTVMYAAHDPRCPHCGTRFEVSPSATAVDDDLAYLDEDLPTDVQVARRSVSRCFGKYVLLHELGRGGTGIVFKAWDTLLGDYVALKFLREPTEKAESDRRRQRADQVRELLQEARALRMRHDNILPILDVGRVGKQIYMAMEYIEGKNLATHIKEARDRGRVSPLYEDPLAHLGVLRTVCQAVHYAHCFRRPLVHCDLKPGNVLISKAGTPYVMDFGLARPLDMPAENEWVVRGTPAYMAPEQLSGRGQDIGVWTDVYGLGGILYELLTGLPVFHGDTTDVMARTSTSSPERPTEVLRAMPDLRREAQPLTDSKLTELERICLKCLARDPSERFASAQDVADEIDVVIAGLETGDPEQRAALLPPEVRVEREKAQTRRRRQGTKDETPPGGQPTQQTQQLQPRSPVEMPERFRQRLAQRINERRPQLPLLQLHEDTLVGVEIVKATPGKIAVFFNDDLRIVNMNDLVPAQVVEIAEGLRMNEPEDRLALGIYCYHTGLSDRAARYLRSLKDTPLERTAGQILQWLGKK